MAHESPPPPSAPSNGIDHTKPQSARIWNYWLGGKDNYPIDREVGDHIAELNPDIVEIARAERAFLGRAVRYLVADAGIRQFLDIGTGLPTADNTHDVAQRVAPESRIVYVDNDPLVLTFARALLKSTREGACDYIDADLNQPDTIVEAATRTLDLTKPVAVILAGVVAHITDDDTADAIVNRLMAAVPVGSHLLLCDSTEVVNPEGMRRQVELWNQANPGTPRVNRAPEQLSRFFDGLELVEPGVVPVVWWRPEKPPVHELDGFGGVGRKTA